VRHRLVRASRTVIVVVLVMNRIGRRHRSPVQEQHRVSRSWGAVPAGVRLVTVTCPRLRAGTSATSTPTAHCGMHVPSDGTGVDAGAYHPGVHP
jgi:hypothetical protein